MDTYTKKIIFVVAAVLLGLIVLVTIRNSYEVRAVNFAANNYPESNYPAPVVSSAPIRAAACGAGGGCGCGGGARQVPTTIGTVNIEDNVQEADIEIGPGVYTPNQLTVKKGVPVKLNFKNIAGGCYSTVVFYDLGIQKTIPEGTVGSIKFTPDKEGTFEFGCPMRMILGKLIVEA